MSPADWLADSEVADTGRIGSTPAPEQWEYLIVGLPEFEQTQSEQGKSTAVSRLNQEGAQGWEAVGMTPLTGGGFAVLLKRRLES